MRAAITLITTRNERSLPRRFSEGFGQMVYEAPHPGTEAPLGQIDGMNSRAVPLLILGQEPNQPSLADARQRQMLRHPHDARASKAHLCERQAVAAAKITGHGYLLTIIIQSKRPSIQVFVGSVPFEAIVIAECLRRLRQAEAINVGGRGDDEALKIAKLACL